MPNPAEGRCVKCGLKDVPLYGADVPGGRYKAQYCRKHWMERGHEDPLANVVAEAPAEAVAPGPGPEVEPAPPAVPRRGPFGLLGG